MSDYENAKEIAASIDEVDRTLCAISDSLLNISEETPTLRDQFAMSAMQGLLGSRYVDVDDEGHKQYLDKMATAAWNLADAMLKARKVE